MLDKEKEISQWDSWLVSAVERIRGQKQGTTLHRIYNCVRLLAEKEHVAEQSRKSPIAPIYKAPFETIHIVEFQRHIDRAVKNGVLLKVTTKGYTVYKTPDKCDRQLNLTNATATNCEYNKEEVTKCVLKVLRELSEADPKASSTASKDSKNRQGYTVTQISEYLRQSHIIQFPPNSPSSCDTEAVIKKLVEGILKKEIAKGHHVKFDNEHYRYCSPKENVKSGKCSKSTPVPVASAGTGTGKRSNGDISRDATLELECKSKRDSRQRLASPSTTTTISSDNKGTYPNNDQLTEQSKLIKCSFLSLGEADYWCVVCGNLAKRDLSSANILNVLTFYFEKIKIDVKPGDIAQHRVCDACFETLEELNDTHEVREKLKTRIRRAHGELIKVSLRGLQKRKSQNLPFFGVHSKIQMTHFQ